MAEFDCNKAVLEAWERHQQIHLNLLKSISPSGLLVVPNGSKGRTVAEQFAHTNLVRLGWLKYHSSGQRPNREALKEAIPADLYTALESSGQAVMEYLEKALKGEVKTRNFGKNPIRFMSYLISHESHHRGQIALALKQAGLRLPEEVSMQGLWGHWIWK